MNIYGCIVYSLIVSNSNAIRHITIHIISNIRKYLKNISPCHWSIE